MDLFDFDDYFLASFVLRDYDYDAQLDAIRRLLRLHRKASEKHSEQIKSIEAYAKKVSGIANEHAVDDWIDHVRQSVFQDAAYSMAAVGMFAPFIESIFKQGFLGIRERMSQNQRELMNHARWGMPQERQWDCQYASPNPNRKNIVEGIRELAEATGLGRHLPEDTFQTLAAIFGYRNKMFHHGFEWPEEERDAFSRRIDESGWPSTWFSKSTSGDSPWIFYMSEIFVEHCMSTIDQIFTGIGAFVRESRSQKREK